jgi:hypothetical protein
MQTPISAPRGPNTRSVRVLCACGAEVAQVAPGLAVRRTRDAPAGEVRRVECSSCGRASSIRLTAEDRS